MLAARRPVSVGGVVEVGQPAASVARSGCPGGTLTATTSRAGGVAST